MLKRLTNWKSTIVAIVILIGCGLAVWQKYATWDQVIGFLTAAGVFAWARDTIFKVDPEKEQP